MIAAIQRSAVCGCRSETLGPIALIDDSSCRWDRTHDILTRRILVLQNNLEHSEVRIAAIERTIRSELMAIRADYDEAVTLGIVPRQRWRDHRPLLARLREWGTELRIVRLEPWETRP